MSEPQSYLDVSESGAVALLQRNLDGPVAMLNLLNLREVADYSAHPHLDPGHPVSGRAAYEAYIAHTLPYLERSGGHLAFLGEGGAWLIGPQGEGWDLAMLVVQDSTDAFMAFAGDEDYLAGIGHREAAVVDSRILPLNPLATPAGGPART